MIFGTSDPKFVYDHGGSGEVEVILGNAVIQRMEPETEYVEHRSQLTSERAFIKRGTHWAVEFRLHIFKAADAMETYAALMAYRGLPVSLWLHRDGEQFKTAGGADALFTIKEVTPFYLTTTDYKDALIVVFESESVVVGSQGISRYMMLLKSHPGDGRAFFFPYSMKNDDFFLLPLADDESQITLSARALTGFTITGAWDAGRVVSLLVTTAINTMAASKVRVGSAANVLASADTQVTFSGSALASSAYLLVAVSDSGVLMLISDQQTTGFKVRSSGETVAKMWYLAVLLTQSDLGALSMRAGSGTAQPEGATITFATALPSADYYLLVVADDGSLVGAERSAAGFVATSVGADTTLKYLAVYKPPATNP